MNKYLKAFLRIVEWVPGFGALFVAFLTIYLTSKYKDNPYFVQGRPNFVPILYFRWWGIISGIWHGSWLMYLVYSTVITF